MGFGVDFRRRFSKVYSRSSVGGERSLRGGGDKARKTSARSASNEKGVQIVEVCLIMPLIVVLMFATMEPLVVWHRYNAIHQTLTRVANEAREMEDLQLDFWVDNSSTSQENLKKYQKARHALSEKFSKGMAEVGHVSIMPVTHLDRLGAAGSSSPEYVSEELGVLAPSTSAYFSWKVSEPNWDQYLRENEDVRVAIEDVRQEGFGTGGEYQRRWGTGRGGTAEGLEEFFLAICERWFPRNATDAGEFTARELAECHYRSHGFNEGRRLIGIRRPDGEADWSQYLKDNEDVKVAIDDVIRDGILPLGQGEYQRRWGVGRGGTEAQIEQFFVDACNEHFGINPPATDASSFSRSQLAECHWAAAGSAQWRRLENKPRELNNSHLCGIRPEGSPYEDPRGEDLGGFNDLFDARSGEGLFGSGSRTGIPANQGNAAFGEAQLEFSALIRSGRGDGIAPSQDVRSWCNVRPTAPDEMASMSKLSELTKHVPTELAAAVEVRGVAPGLFGGYKMVVAVPFWHNKTRNGMYRGAASPECSWSPVEWEPQPTACGAWVKKGVQKDSCGNQREVLGESGCNPCWELSNERRVYAEGKSCGSYRSVHDEDNGCGTLRVGVDSGDAKAGCQSCATREIGHSWTGDDCGGQCGNRVSAKITKTDECRQWDEDWAEAPGWEACDKSRQYKTHRRTTGGMQFFVNDGGDRSCVVYLRNQKDGQDNYRFNTECADLKTVNQNIGCVRNEYGKRILAINVGCESYTITGSGAGTCQNCIYDEVTAEDVCSSSGARVTGGEPWPTGLDRRQETVVQNPTPRPVVTRKPTRPVRTPEPKSEQCKYFNCGPNGMMCSSCVGTSSQMTGGKRH